MSQICILMRNGAEVWVNEEKLDSLMDKLEKNRFIKVGNQIINSADVSGAFTEETMTEQRNLKMGMWKCEAGNYWHSRNEQCGHR